VAKRTTPSKPERPFHTPDQKRLDIQRLLRRIKELGEFDPQSVTQRFTDPKVTAVETAIDETLASVFGHGTVEFNRYSSATKLDHGPLTVEMPSWIAARGGGRSGFRDEAAQAQHFVAQGKEQALGLLRQAVKGLHEEIADEEALCEPVDLPDAIAKTAASAKGSADPSNKVLLVHGRDDAAKNEVALFLRAIGLDPIILHLRPNGGRHLLTKFREESEGAAFAVVLMTPDDEGQLAGSATLPPERVRTWCLNSGFSLESWGLVTWPRS
jgi:Predicted nucleotide-binding protein containing TIR-like domain